MSAFTNVGNILIPDSELMKKSARLVAELSPPFLYHHCLRT
ncbi:MAG TPA: hypothetical protein VGX03_01825 [Candidatus Binatia bacterium]|nr:hypothetical protein [Candidatus Binatia bacterium]